MPHLVSIYTNHAKKKKKKKKIEKEKKCSGRQV